jgi:hypothetical protein
MVVEVHQQGPDDLLGWSSFRLDGSWMGMWAWCLAMSDRRAPADTFALVIA